MGIDVRRRWAALRWIAALGLVIGAVLSAAPAPARAQEGGQGDLETASLAPADSLVFVSLNTDPGSQQWGVAADLLEQAGVAEVVYGAIDQLIAESGLPAEWITPGSSLLGNEVSIALVTGGPNGVDPVILLSSASPNQAFETARGRFTAAFGDEIITEVGSEEGLTLITAPFDDASLARVDDLILFGTPSGVQQAVGVAYGAEPSLADQPAFSDLVDELREDRLLTVWTNGPAVSASQALLGAAAGGLAAQETALLVPALGQVAGVYQAAGVWAEEEGFRLDTRTMAGPRSEELTAPDETTELAERAPDDALLFVDGMDLGQVQVIRNYLESIAFGFGAQAAFDADPSGWSEYPFAYPTLEESYAALEDLLGFDVRADLADLLLGDYGLWVSTSSLESVSDVTAVLVSDVSDASTVDASVDRLVALLRAEAGGELTVNAIRVADATVTELLVPDGGAGHLRLTVGVVEGQLLIGVGAGMEQYLDGPRESSLAADERFEAAFDALPDDDGGRFYLDLNSLLRLAAEGGAGGELGPEEAARLASLDAVQALAAVTRMDGDTQVMSVVLTVDAAAAGDPDDDGGAEASPTTGEAPSVSEALPVRVEGRLISMSPADAALLVFDPETDEVCIVTPTGDEEACGGPVRSVDTLHVSWSPDGRRVAFTEDAARFFVDGDVLVFDRDAGELQNWTDDGYEGDVLGIGDEVPPGGAPIDMTPVWTPDGDAVVFGRSIFGDASGIRSTILYRVAGPGAEPDAVAPVALFPFATYYGLGYAPDGRLVYTNTTTDPTDPETGLFELAADGRSVRQVLATSEALGPPYLLGVTSAGSALVVYRNVAAQRVPGDDRCLVELVDLTTTDRTPMRLPDGSCATFGGVTPDGGMVVLYAGGQDGPRVALVAADAPDAAPMTIDLGDVLADADGDDAPPYLGDEDFGLSVAAGGRVLLRDGPSGGVLLTLVTTDVVGETPVASGEGTTPPQATAWRVTRRTTFPLDNEFPLGMSPTDGVLLVAQAGEALCILGSGGGEEMCVGWERPIEGFNVAWSADGRRVAFTEDSRDSLRDGDIWVIDRDTGQLHNWTDDGYAGPIPTGPERGDAPDPLAVDQTPVWTADGTAIVFARTEVGSDLSAAPTALYRVNGPGAEVELVADVSSAPFATSYGVAAGPDGDIVYTATSGDGDQERVGLYVLEPGESTPRLVVTRERGSAPTLLGQTAGDQVHVSVPVIDASQIETTEACGHLVIDLGTGEETEVRHPDGSCATYAGLMADGRTVVMWSPAGEGPRMSTLDVSGGASEAVDVGLGVLANPPETGGALGLRGNIDDGLWVTEDGLVLLRASVAEEVTLVQLEAA